MDVDAAPGEPFAHAIGQDLHVPRQYHQFGLRLAHDIRDAGFLFAARGGGDRQVMERNAVQIDMGIGLPGMVGDDGHRFDGQFADAPAVQQIHKAMVKARDHDDGAGGTRVFTQRPFHAEPGGDLRQRHVQPPARNAIGRHAEHDAHEEDTAFAFIKLLGTRDIPTQFKQRVADRGDNTRTVRA